MLKEYTFWFYCLLSILVFTVPINSVSRHTRQASRRQDGPDPDGPPPGMAVAFPDGPGGPPEPGKPADIQQETTDDSDTDRSIEQVRMTDLSAAAVDDTLVLDYGRYTTLSFHYEQRQWLYSPMYDTCYDDYMKCYTTLINPMPVCIMYNTRFVKTYDTYCDVYFENCRLFYRYWRIVGYGKCTVGFFGYPFLDDYWLGAPKD